MRLKGSTLPRIFKFRIQRTVRVLRAKKKRTAFTFELNTAFWPWARLGDLVLVYQFRLDKAPSYGMASFSDSEVSRAWRPPAIELEIRGQGLPNKYGIVSATVTCPGWSKISVFMHTLNEDDWEEFKPEGSSKTISELKPVWVPGSFGPPKVQVAGKTKWEFSGYANLKKQLNRQQPWFDWWTSQSKQWHRRIARREMNHMGTYHANG